VFREVIEDEEGEEVLAENYRGAEVYKAKAADVGYSRKWML
jgi:hypothetical protein